MLVLQQLWHLSPLVNAGYHRKVVSSFTIDMTHGIFLSQLRIVRNYTTAYHWHNDLKGRYQRSRKEGQDPAGVQNVNLQKRKGLTLVVPASKTTEMLYLGVNVSHP